MIIIIIIINLIMLNFRPDTTLWITNHILLRRTSALKCDGRMWHGAFADSDAIHCHLTDAVIVNECSCNDQHMEYLMRLELRTKIKKKKKNQIQ